MATISSIRALEVLDSRGNPTVHAHVVLDDGSLGTASVPSGASTGVHEAHELRDGDPKRYGGKGVQHAVAQVNGEIGKALKRRKAEAQDAIDRRLCELDGTANKERLGANALLAVSLAVARAAALSQGLPLYVYLRRLAGKASAAYVLPLPLMNLLNGGAHADSGLDVQEFMVLPVGAVNFQEALRCGAEVFHAATGLLQQGGYATSVGDEGGYAPRLGRNDEALALLAQAVEKAGYALRDEVVLGIDAAASEFYEPKERTYVLRSPQVTLNRERLLALYLEWAKRWPLKTIEDPLEQDDWEGWAAATAKLREVGVQVVGDDFFVTNAGRLQRGIERKCATAILVKPNQIGTLSETMAAIRLAQKHGYGVIVSHRSGETADTFIADLAVATDAGQIKAGSLSRSERVAKYNRLLEIEAELGEQAHYAGSQALRF